MIKKGLRESAGFDVFRVSGKFLCAMHNFGRRTPDVCRRPGRLKAQVWRRVGRRLKGQTGFAIGHTKREALDPRRTRQNGEGRKAAAEYI